MAELNKKATQMVIFLPLRNNVCGRKIKTTVNATFNPKSYRVFKGKKRTIEILCLNSGIQFVSHERECFIQRKFKTLYETTVILKYEITFHFL